MPPSTTRKFPGSAIPVRAYGSVVGLAIVGCIACAQPIRSGALIDRYIQAQCIPFTTEPGRFRAWDHTLQISGDRIARVAGQQTPGGRIEVRFEPEYEPSVAANAGDYIYPSDVRVATDDRLYVRADGRRAAFGGQQTWLFEYDLQKRRRTMRARIDPNILPALCPPKQ